MIINKGFPVVRYSTVNLKSDTHISDAHLFTVNFVMDLLEREHLLDASSDDKLVTTPYQLMPHVFSQFKENTHSLWIGYHEMDKDLFKSLNKYYTWILPYESSMPQYVQYNTLYNTDESISYLPHVLIGKDNLNYDFLLNTFLSKTDTFKSTYLKEGNELIIGLWPSSYIDMTYPQIVALFFQAIASAVSNEDKFNLTKENKIVFKILSPTEDIPNFIEVLAKCSNMFEQSQYDISIVVEDNIIDYLNYLDYHLCLSTNDYNTHDPLSIFLSTDRYSDTRTRVMSGFRTELLDRYYLKTELGKMLQQVIHSNTPLHEGVITQIVNNVNRMFENMNTLLQDYKGE